MKKIVDECNILENIDANEVIINNEEYNNILNLQSEILSMLASRTSSKLILAHLCKLAENLLPNAVASIMKLDDKTKLISVLSAPSVPESGHEALKNLTPGPGGGSCGNAVFHNTAQFVTDTHTDPRWTDIRQIAYDYNLCSCWSMPVKDINQKAIGTFALSSFEHCSPSKFHKKLLEAAASIVSIVLRNEKNDIKTRLFS